MCNHLSQLFFSFLFYFLRHSNLTFLNQLGILLEKHLRSHLPYVRRRLVDPVQLYIQTTRAELLRSQLSAGRRGRINGQVGQAKLALQGNGRRAGYRCRKKKWGSVGNEGAPARATWHGSNKPWSRALWDSLVFQHTWGFSKHILEGSVYKEFCLGLHMCPKTFWFFNTNRYLNK